jgi:dipeptide/tripeptide permease
MPRVIRQAPWSRCTANLVGGSMFYATCGRKGSDRGKNRAPNWERFDVSTWDTLIPPELVQWLPFILIALLIIYAMVRSSRRPREPAPPRRFSFGRMLLVALFLAGLAFLIKWGR